MEVLDQSEIDALLAAADEKKVEDTKPATTIYTRTRRDLNGVEVRKYDFKRPERVSKDQMRSLQTLHEGFGRNLGAGLSGFLRTIIEVKVSTCEQLTYSEFIAGLPNPTSFNLLKAEPLEGQICLEISPLIIYPIIDRLLGGTNRELFIPQRPHTAIESRLINKITNRALEGLKEAWSTVKELDFSIVGSESNPHLVQIVPPNEVVVVIGFEVKMANRAGTMNLCIPYAVIEPLMNDLAAQSWFSTGKVKGSSEYEKRLKGQLSAAPLEVTGILAKTSITVRDLFNLGVGDIITTERPASDPVEICVEGEPKLYATIGQFKGARALKVVRPIVESDRN